MKTLTYISYEEHCELYPKIHGLPSDTAVIFYRVGASSDVKGGHIKFTLSAGTLIILTQKLR